MNWLLSLSCLDCTDTPTTLYFSSAAWRDATKRIYQNRLKQPALINLSANDGGVLSLFKESSIGEIELDNTDGELDFMVGYAFDGREAKLSNGTTDYYLGVVERMSEPDNSIYFAFKSISETLNNNYPQSAYDSATDSPAWDSGLDGKLKPIVFGQCRGITPVLIDATNSIYQASSGSDCRIVAVYYDGQRLTNYKVNGAHTAGDTTIDIDSGIKGVPTNAQIIFNGDDTIYTVSTGITAISGTITITPALTANLADNTVLDVINTYASLGDLQTDAAKTNDDLTKVAVKWGSYQGFFHLSGAAVGVVTCDVITVSGTTQRKVYDVIEDVIDGCGIADLTVNTADQVIDHNIYGQTTGATVKTTVNGLGYAGYFISTETPIKTVLDALIKSFAGYYWFDNTELNIKILDAPASTALDEINEYQIESIRREATGLGNNGLPVKGWLLKYLRNWTVLTTVAGVLGTARKELLAKDYQEIGKDYVNATTEARHALSEKITLESLLTKKAKAQLVYNQLDDVTSVRRDVIILQLLDIRLLSTIQIGQTYNVITSQKGYNLGKKFVVIGIEPNLVDETILIRAFG